MLAKLDAKSLSKVQYRIMRYVMNPCLEMSSRASEQSKQRKGGSYGWKPSSSSNLSIRVVRACPHVEIRQKVPCRAIRGNCISVNSTLPPSIMIIIKIMIIMIMIMMIMMMIIQPNIHIVHTSKSDRDENKLRPLYLCTYSLGFRV